MISSPIVALGDNPVYTGGVFDQMVGYLQIHADADIYKAIAAGGTGSDLFALIVGATAIMNPRKFNELNYS